MSSTLCETNSPAVADHFDRLGRIGYWSALYEQTRDPRIEWSFARRQLLIEEMADDLAQPGAFVLEIGPGSGNLVPYLAARGCRYLGLDVAESMVAETSEMIRRCFAPEVDAACRRGDIHQVDLPDGHADLVIASGVFEYLPDMSRAARELARVCKPATGRALISFPNAASLNRILGKRLGLITSAWHAARRAVGATIAPPDVDRSALSPSAAAALFENCGWQVERIGYYDLEVLPYPFKRIAPNAAFAAKRFAETRRLAPPRRFANGFVIRLRRAG